MVGEVGKEGKIEQVQNKRPPQRRRCLLSSGGVWVSSTHESAMHFHKLLEGEVEALLQQTRGVSLREVEAWGRIGLESKSLFS